MARRVAITGLGLVTPLGTDVQSTWDGLLAGRSGAGPITRFDPVQSPVKFACEVKGFDPAQFLDKKEIRRYDLFAQFAIGAAEQAVADACLATSWDTVNLKRVGVLIGTGTGGLQTFEENCRALFEKGPSRVSPFFVPMYMPNVAAALISMRYGAKGPNYCTVSACASSAHSVGDALEIIRNDQADIIIAGGAEAAITPLAVASFANMKALSERNDDPASASRPFDKDRDGFVMGDGAGVLVLEEWDHARRRGAKIYAEVTGYGMTADAHHITAPAPHAARRRRRDGRGEGGVRRAGPQAGVRLHQVDDRSPAGGGRRPRGSGERPGRATRHHPPDHQPVHARSRLRSRLGAQQSREAAGGGGPVELLRVRRAQRDAGDQAGGVMQTRKSERGTRNSTVGVVQRATLHFCSDFRVPRSAFCPA